MNKYFYLPGYYQKYELIYHLIKYREQHPEQFIEDRIIAGAYDLPPGLAWNGGRVNLTDNLNYVKAHTYNMMKFYFDQPDFTLLHTCTNLFADINDIDNNNFLNKYYRPQDKVIVASKELKTYLENNNPNMSFVWSTTLLITNIAEINQLTQKEIYVISFEKNDDDNYLKQLLYPNNIEILCAEPCLPGCPNRQQHYNLISHSQIIQDETKNLSFCTYSKKVNWKTAEEMINSHPCRINNQRIDELNTLGFSYFKLSGRSLPDTIWLQIVIYYLVKEQYKKQVYKNLLDIYTLTHSIKI